MGTEGGGLKRLVPHIIRGGPNPFLRCPCSASSCL